MRRTKHNARKVTERVGGVVCHFDSIAEYKYALWLERERKAKRVFDWEHHPAALDLHASGGAYVCQIAPDFRVWRDRGARDEYHEVKGMATAAWRLKRKLFEAEYPHKSYIVIDAGQPGDVEKGIAPELFDTRAARKRARKKARASKPVKKARK